MTKKLCTASGCNAIIDHVDDGSSPRCPKHKRAYQAKKPQELKFSHHLNEKGQSVYSTYRWKKLRAAKAAVNPLCEHCERNGIAKPVKDVDHIIAIEDGGSIWDIGNLQSLCRMHHIRKTNAEVAARKQKTCDYGYMLDANVTK